MDAKMLIEINFDYKDVEKFKSILARYITTRIAKEILSYAFEKNTEQSLTDYQQVIQHIIYSTLCKKFKSKVVMKSLKEVDAIVTKNFNEQIKNYAQMIWRDLESLINLISLNKEYKEICYDIFFECLNTNLGGGKNDGTGKNIGKMVENREEGREKGNEKERGE
jgi:hypothetical protein